MRSLKIFAYLIIAGLIAWGIIGCSQAAHQARIEEQERQTELKQTISAKIEKGTQLWKTSSNNDELIMVADVVKSVDGHIEGNGRGLSNSDTWQSTYSIQRGYVIIWLRGDHLYTSGTFDKNQVVINYKPNLDKSTVSFEMDYTNIDNGLDISSPVDMLNYCCFHVDITVNDLSILLKSDNNDSVIQMAHKEDSNYITTKCHEWNVIVE